MTKGKKYDFRIKQMDAFWTVEIIRKATSKKTIVSKRQSGFTSEAEAQEWGQKELKAFLQNLHEQNKRRSLQKEQKSIQ
ncbi:MAG: DUF3622 domain-containing protein [Nitrosomonas sp.]|nr:DUF3622 domain-containing protein [Nitrosomonas sp.]